MLDNHVFFSDRGFDVVKSSPVPSDTYKESLSYAYSQQFLRPAPACASTSVFRSRVAQQAFLTRRQIFDPSISPRMCRYQNGNRPLHQV
jgi:hypothetical protein